MTFSEYAAKSVSDAMVLIQINIGNNNSQWINAGSGIWKMNMLNSYPEVDATLLDGFTAQAFGVVGSLTVDGILQTEAASLLALTGDTEAYYWDGATQTLYVCLVNYDEPSLHDVFLGIIWGYSFDEFIPMGSRQLFEGRLLGSPQISQSRDPLYWGKMQFAFGGVTLINADGAFDTFAQDNDAYGNETQIYFGYKQLDIADYIRIHTGVIQSIGVSEEEAQFNIADKRIQLTKPIQYVCTSLNALDAIVAILVASYGVQYNDTYFDTTAWDAASALVDVITIDMKQVGATIDVIEEICASVFGLFLILPDNRFSFKIVDTTASALTTIVAADILNHHSYNYDPSEVISSVKVGYDKNWDSDYVSPYTFVIDTSEEAAVFLKYKTYNQKTFYTLLTTASAASAFGTKVLTYAKDVHGIGDITVPMKYYSYGVADIVNAEINRETTTMLGTKKVEIISKRYNLRDANLTFWYRIV